MHAMGRVAFWVFSLSYHLHIHHFPIPKFWKGEEQMFFFPLNLLLFFILLFIYFGIVPQFVIHVIYHFLGWGDNIL